MCIFFAFIKILFISEGSIFLDVYFGCYANVYFLSDHFCLFKSYNVILMS